MFTMRTASFFRQALCTTAGLTALLLSQGAAQNREPLATGARIRVTHRCTLQADTTRGCVASLPSPIVGAFAGISQDAQLRVLVADSVGSAQIPVDRLITVEVRRRSVSGRLGGGVIGLLAGAGFGVLLLESVVPGAQLEGGGSVGAKLAFSLPVNGCTVVGALIGGAERWHDVALERLRP